MKCPSVSKLAVWTPGWGWYRSSLRGCTRHRRGLRSFSESYSLGSAESTHRYYRVKPVGAAIQCIKSVTVPCRTHRASLLKNTPRYEEPRVKLRINILFYFVRNVLSLVQSVRTDQVCKVGAICSRHDRRQPWVVDEMVSSSGW